MKILLEVYDGDMDSPSVDAAVVEISPADAMVLAKMVEDFASMEAHPVYGRPSLIEYSDYSVDFFDSDLLDEGEKFPSEIVFRKEVCQLCVDQDAVYWSCHEKHTLDLYETCDIGIKALKKLAAMPEGDDVIRVEEGKIVHD